MKTEVSFVIPFLDEERNLTPLCNQISDVMNKLSKTYEIILIDDGSIDRSLQEARIIADKNNNIKIIIFRRNFGKSAGFSAGFRESRGKYVITMDADLQDDPKEIPRFIKKLDEGFDLVVGWKRKRHDAAFFVSFSKIANWLIRKSTGLKIHDLNCGFKAYKSKLAKSLNLYGEQFRFIPVFAKIRGFDICEIPVTHHARKFGRSKYSAKKVLKGLLDFFTVMFFSGFGTRPMHFFGGLGLAGFALGFIVALVLTFQKLVYGFPLSDRPLLLLAALLMVFGVQLISMGILGEVVLDRTLKSSDTYEVQEIINSKK
ncbi:glycosyltransferase family 2 protein [Patescibacteria group bacterium]